MLRKLRDARKASVICLQAPGGYGKTTVVTQWLLEDLRQTVWLSVRPVAADAAWVAQQLLNGLADAGLIDDRVVLTGSVDPAVWHLNALPLVETLVAGVAEPFVLVVDGADAVGGSAWDCLVESVAASLPAGAQLVLITRDAMPATLWRLHGRGRVAILGPDVLALDAYETRRLLSTFGLAASADDEAALAEQTEGWPVLVYLAGLSMRSEGRRRPMASAIGGARLAEYLREEVIATLPDDDAAFLFRISVLTILDPASCDETAETTGSLRRLRRLAAINHLLLVEDDAGECFRMHALLADALSEQFHEDDPAAWRGAQAAASRAEERRGDLDAAVHHARLAGDDVRLGRLVFSGAGHLLGTGQWSALDRWLEGLDEARLASECGLALSAAHAGTHTGHIGRISRMALAASQVAHDRQPEYALDAGLLDAIIGAEGLGQIEAASRAFMDGKPLDDVWQTVAYYLLGVALLMRDEQAEAMACLREGYRLSVALKIPLMAALCLASMANVALTEDAVTKALSCIREIRELTVRYRLDTIAVAAPFITTSAVGYVHEGRFADARTEAARALRLTALMRPIAPWFAVQGRLALAQLNIAFGDPERAKVLVDEAADLRGPHTASPLLDRTFAETAQRLSAVSTNLATASSLTTSEVRVLQYLPTHLSFPEIAAELFVSRHTVKTQAMSAYRKLGVHSRTEAITRARQAGLLPPG